MSKLNNRSSAAGHHGCNFLFKILLSFLLCLHLYPRPPLYITLFFFRCNSTQDSRRISIAGTGHPRCVLVKRVWILPVISTAPVLKGFYDIGSTVIRRAAALLSIFLLQFPPDTRLSLLSTSLATRS